MWERIKAFLKRKDVEVSVKRYGIDALGAMAQGLFCSLLRSVYKELHADHETGAADNK